MDEAMLPWIAGLWWLLLRIRCDVVSAHRNEKILLGLCVFLCCFTDWYGVVITGFATLACLTVSVRTHGSRAIARTLLPFAIGAIAAAIPYGIQLWIYQPGLSMVTKKYEMRSAMPAGTSLMIQRLISELLKYLPLPNAIGGILALGVGTIGIRELAGLHPHRGYLALFGAMCVAPIVWTLLLPEHSYTHHFSLLKFSLPTVALMTLGCCAIAAALQKTGHPERTSAGLFGVLTAAVILSSWHVRHVPFEIPEADAAALEREEILVNIGNGEIPLSNDGLLAGSFPAQRSWRSPRMIHVPIRLLQLQRQGIVSTDALASYNPVWLAVMHDENPPAFPACEGKWKREGSIAGKTIVSCRSATLRQWYLLLDPAI